MDKTTVWILGNQLLETHPALAYVADKADAHVLQHEERLQANPRTSRSVWDLRLGTAERQQV